MESERNPDERYPDEYGAASTEGPATTPSISTHTTATHTVIQTDRGTPTHAARPPRPRARLIAAICGALAATAAIGIGGAAILKSPDQVSTGLTSANLITVAPRIPLTDRELITLVGRNPDFGDLTNPKRRASCLNGLGYPANMQVLGAQPAKLNGQTVIVLVLPGDRPDELLALAVTPSCSSAGTRLIAETTVTRP